MTYQPKQEIKMYLTRDSAYVEINGTAYKNGERTENIAGSVDLQGKLTIQGEPEKWRELVNKPPVKGEHLVRVHGGEARKTTSELIEILDILPDLFSQGRNLDSYEVQQEVAREVGEKIRKVGYE